MSERCPSLRSALEEFEITGKDEPAVSPLFRDQLEKSEFLKMMQSTCDLINTEARGLVINAQAYLPPGVRVRTFSFLRGKYKHIMQVELVGSKTVVAFLTQRKKGVLSRVSYWMYGSSSRAAQGKVKLVSAIRPEEVTEANIEEWFIYLLSGLDRAFMPFTPLPTSQNRKTGNGHSNPETVKHSSDLPAADSAEAKQHHDSLYRAGRYVVNALLVVSILAAIYSIGWEYSTRRYLKGFSDAIVPDMSSPEDRIDAILNWMAHSPLRKTSAADSFLPNRDPTETLNYEDLLQVCGSATNAFINLADSSGLEARRLLLLDSHQRTKHVVAEVFDNGRWIVVDPAFRVIPRGIDGKPLTRAQLTDPATFAAATRSIPRYDPDYTYNLTAHIRLARLSYPGLALQKLLDGVVPGWDDSTTLTLIAERESFAAMMAAIFLALFLIVLRISLHWYRERWLASQEAGIRQQALEVSFNASK